MLRLHTMSRSLKIENFIWALSTSFRSSSSEVCRNRTGSNKAKSNQSGFVVIFVSYKIIIICLHTWNFGMFCDKLKPQNMFPECLCLEYKLQDLLFGICQDTLCNVSGNILAEGCIWYLRHNNQTCCHLRWSSRLTQNSIHDDQRNIMLDVKLSLITFLSKLFDA